MSTRKVVTLPSLCAKLIIATSVVLHEYRKWIAAHQLAYDIGLTLVDEIKTDPTLSHYWEAAVAGELTDEKAEELAQLFKERLQGENDTN